VGDGIAAITQLNEHEPNGNHSQDVKNGNDISGESQKEKDDLTNPESDQEPGSVVE